MLSRIRENLSTWVIAILLFLVAIPLIFMGLGNYQTTSETFSFKINDRTITSAQLEQEVYQYRQALQKNFGGAIPLLYTNKFIRNITVDYMMRTILMDQTSRALGLAFHNKSILNQIYATSSFKDEKGFNTNIYKSQLYKINMTPKNYERYVYQKGITEQLKKSITDTAILTNTEKDDLLKSRYHERIIGYLTLNYDDIKTSIKIPKEKIEHYYKSNKKNYMTSRSASFSYLDINKNEIINKVKIDDDKIKNIYSERLTEGEYTEPTKYDLNHILIPHNKEALNTAKKAHNSLLKGKTYKEVAKVYSKDIETQNSEGYLGEFILDDLPDYLSNSVSTLETNEISTIIESDKGYHIISINKKTIPKDNSYQAIRPKLIKEYKKEIGTRKYFDLIDGISEINFTKQTTLQNIADEFNLNIKTSKPITEIEGYSIFNYDFVRKELFKKEVLEENITSDLIYLNDDRFIIGQKKSYQKPEQMSYEDSKEIISALLREQESDNEIIKIAENIRDDMNANIVSKKYNFKTFKGTIDSKTINDNLRNIFFSANSNIGYQTSRLNNNDYIVFAVNSIKYPKNIKNLKDSDDFYNFALNTRSETEFKYFYNVLKSKADIEINYELINRD